MVAWLVLSGMLADVVAGTATEVVVHTNHGLADVVDTKSEEVVVGTSTELDVLDITPIVVVVVVVVVEDPQPPL